MPHEQILSRYRIAFDCAPVASRQKKLTDALAAVNANLKTPEGKQYDARLGTELPQKYGTDIRKCKSAPVSGPFDLFVKLNSEGKVTEVLFYPESDMAKCVANALGTAQFSPPPHGDYWVNIHLEFKK